MTRGILIIGAESSLLAALAAEAGKRVECFAMAAIPSHPADAERGDVRTGGASRIALNWNPGSPISARTLAAAAQNRLGHIDEAVLVCVPPLIRGEAEELSPVLVEKAVNDHIKGWFFLAKELCAAFNTRGSGTLALVLSESGPSSARDEPPNLIGAAAGASFRAFSQALISASAHKPYQALGFSSESGDDAPFAAYIFKIMEEGGRRNTGKWHKFGRHGLFH
ncbi:MAG: hypothetical protein LBD08_00020 [Treponema sp.]|jgi:hypothetical protein|nr:hypothetical protein [Treponema sp.]